MRPPPKIYMISSSDYDRGRYDKNNKIYMIFSADYDRRQHDDEEQSSSPNQSACVAKS
jgi:hypothetical protein